MIETPPPNSINMAAMEAETFDYIVVGGGSAGCILAERLSADGRTRVLILEAGGIDRNWLLHLPIGAARVWNNPAFNWSYQSAPEPHANGRSIYHPRGKVLGGSAAINMMAYVRGNPGDYDRWAQMGLTDWSYEKVLPYFRACESFKEGADDWRGGVGPILTQRHPASDPLLDAWLEAGKASGYSVTPDYNGQNQEGFDRFQFNIGEGRRSNSAVRFLRPALTRANLKLVTDALVDKLDFDGTRASGVVYEAAGVRSRASARAEIVMAAGAYNTPQILMRSGVGPADHLQSLGITPLIDRRAIGANLQDHPAVGLDYKRKHPGDLYNQIRLDRLGLNILRAWYLRSGPATLPIASGTAFVKSAPEIEIPDIQLLMRGYSPEMGPWFPLLKSSKPDGLGVTACHLRPQARGSLALASTDPRAAPVFVNNFLDNEFDRRAMRNGFKIARRVMTQSAFDDVRADERLPGPSVQRDDEIDAYIRESVRTVFHPCGTCRMGVDEASVVDPQLRVRGLTGLRIADASVMPDVVGGNINACVMMIALKGAQAITGRM